MATGDFRGQCRPVAVWQVQSYFFGQFTTSGGQQRGIRRLMSSTGQGPLPRPRVSSAYWTANQQNGRLRTNNDGDGGVWLHSG